MKTDGFYIKHKNIEEAFHFVGLTLGGGYNTYESLGEVERLKELEHVGVDRYGDVVFFDDPVDYGKNAKEMTLQQVRDMFKRKTEPADSESCLDSDSMDHRIRETAFNSLSETKKDAHRGAVVSVDKDVFFGGQKDVEWVDGLPPVGCECEYIDLEDLEWRKCEILAHKGKEVVFWDIEGEYSNNYQMASSFRPIQAQEEIERENYINEMFKDAEVVGSKSAFERLVDKGYRKINPISDEDICNKIRELGSDNDYNKGAVAWGINWAIETMLGKK